ncbi:MAG: hypothetical protein R3E98_00510 [Gemmatimonadota bacterium]|nr:hypothetical protein [Gemmatimonadota bacterium]
MLSLLAGCAPPDAGLSPPVAAVGTDSLTVDRLAELLVLAQPLPLEPAPVEALVRHWIEVTALAVHVRGGGDPLADSLVTASLWLELRERALGGATPAPPSTQVALEAGAVEVARGLARTPERPPPVDAPLVRTSGAVFSASDLRRYLLFLPAEAHAEIAVAPEAEVAAFLGSLATREGAARDRLAEVPQSVRDSLVRAGRARIADALQALRTPQPDAAVLDVDAYFDALVARRTDQVALPPLLAAALLDAVAWELDADGLEQALQQARALLGGAGA